MVLQEPLNSPTSDKESSKISEGIQEKINQELTQIYNQMAFEVILKAYQYYIEYDSDWDDHLWDRRAKEVYDNKEVLEERFRKVFDKLNPKHLSMYFLTTEDYRDILHKELIT